VTKQEARAKKEARIWTKEFERIYENGKLQSAPRIVLWGPAPADREGYKKRKKVELEIRKEHPSAAVLLPEHHEAGKITRAFAINLVLQELLQAKGADLIIALAFSPGVSAEIALCLSNHEIARRLIIIAPESLRKTFLGELIKVLKVHYVKDQELVNCKKARELCRREVRAWVIAKSVGGDLVYA